MVRLQLEFDVSLDWRGFELHPETPSGGRDLADLFGADRLAGMHLYLRSFARSFGVADFDPPQRMNNTRPALALAELARERGRLDPYRAAAMDAYWRDHADLEDPATLERLARAADVGEDAVTLALSDPRYLFRVDATRREAEDAGVTGIPTLFIGRYRIAGCQPYEVVADVARRAGAPERPPS